VDGKQYRLLPNEGTASIHGGEVRLRLGRGPLQQL
jgi:galactose mutarotase-like enzyme